MLIKLDEISEKIAEKLNMKPNDVRLINRSQWKLLHETMQSGTLKPMSIIYLGKFSEKKKKNDWFKKQRDIKRIQESSVQE
jgi:hypothetical protein